MKIPVYLCTLSKEAYSQKVRDLRFHMFQLCRDRWRMEPGADLQVIMPEALGCSPRAFQRNRRVWAEEKEIASQRASHGRGEAFYVVADDDCLPVHPRPFLGNLVEVMRDYPEFAVLSLWPSNSVLGRWKASDLPGYVPFEDDRVMEHVSVGGVRVCRAGCLEAWPEMADGLWSYDSQQAEALRAAGYRVGYFKQEVGQDYPAMNHLGRHYSAIWPSPKA